MQAMTTRLISEINFHFRGGERGEGVYKKNRAEKKCVVDFSQKKFNK